MIEIIKLGRCEPIKLKFHCNYCGCEFTATDEDCDLLGWNEREGVFVFECYCPCCGMKTHSRSVCEENQNAKC